MQDIPGYLKKPIKILYEDDGLLAFDKPAGLLSVPTEHKEKNTLLDIVNFQYAPKDKAWMLYPCHRLDRDTSGVILFAKGKHRQEEMMAEFKKREVKKIYIGFVYGRLDKLNGEIRSNIRSLEKKKFNKHSQGEFAITKYKVTVQKKHFSVVEMMPVTGRTNQIRIQFKQIGHPLVGDRKYAFVRDYSLKFRRTALHSHILEWTHPVSHKKITVTSTLPNDMEVFLARN